MRSHAVTEINQSDKIEESTEENAEERNNRNDIAIENSTRESQ